MRYSWTLVGAIAARVSVETSVRVAPASGGCEVHFCVEFENIEHRTPNTGKNHETRGEVMH